ncbi:MAG: hypothetical protein WDO19_13270 [Bacteroidota bacterium]
MIRFFCLLFLFPLYSFSQQLTVWNPQLDKLTANDWLVKPVTDKAGIYESSDKKNIILYNGLLKRSFRISPNVACVDFKNMSNGQQLLRAIKPEARITIDNTVYNIGGLYGQDENAYLLPEWIDDFKAGDNDFHFVKFETGNLQPFLQWKNKTWASNEHQPTGKIISFIYQSPVAALRDIVVKVNYELYDGIYTTAFR